MTKKKEIKRKKKLKRVKRLTFLEHLEELRSRIITCIVTLLIGTSVGYFLRKNILEILTKPLNQTIFYTSPTGGLNFVFSVSLLFGFLFALPVIIYQIIKFIEPALSKKIPNFLFAILISSALLLILGINFAYFIGLPTALYFFNTFTTGNVKALITTDEYFSFVIHYVLSFGVIFQLPLVMIAINAIHRFDLKKLLSYERWVILISFIVSAILTPTPDILNQIIFALPLILLYQLTILFLWLINTKKFVRM